MFSKSKTTFKSSIFIPSIIIVLITAAASLAVPKQFEEILNIIKQQIFVNFSWFYVLAVAIFLFFLVLLSFSSFGNIKLGADDDKPEFHYVSWMAMLFAAGTGIGIMFWGVAEPISHYKTFANLPEDQRIATSLVTSIFHWGISAWAIYGVVGLSLAYFGFRYKLPLTIRSGLYPILKGKTAGFWGHLIDVVALCSTIFGVTTTLGYGALQMDAGLHAIGWLPEGSNFTTLTIIIFAVMLLSTISAITGVTKGVRILSEINFGMALLLLLFVLIAGPTLYILYSFSENLGNYLSDLIKYSLRTFAYQQDKQSWFYGWTILYWAWWVSWAPFVGLFIARISRGRTIREFVLGVLFIPSLFYIFWVSVFGNAAIHLDQAQHVLTAAHVKVEQMLFILLNSLPYGTIASFMSILIIALFFVTSADSGIFVINNIASQGRDGSPAWQSIFWGVILAILATALLYSGGIGALQTMTLIIALPFTAILLVVCYGLYKGLQVDSKYFNRKLAYGSVHWDANSWKDRLDAIISQFDKKDVAKFVKTVAAPALMEVKKEFIRKGVNATIEEFVHKGLPAVKLVITKEGATDFVYGVHGLARKASKQAVESDSFHFIESEIYYIPCTFFEDGREGYDASYFTKDEIIIDVLKQYERHLSLTLAESTDLITADNDM